MNNFNLIVRMDIILDNSCTDYLISYEVVRILCICIIDRVNAK